MIIVRANARNATYISDDLITSGSVGIPVMFNLSEDFDGLSAIAVFEGSGTARDVALIGDTCVVPHEVLATAGGYLRIGIYASNSAGTIVIPTVWAGSKMILQGTEPSEVDPFEPTPSWVAQVQEAAAEALQTANNVLDMTVEADTLSAGSEATVEKTVDPDTGAVTLEFGIPRGEQGVQGEQGIPGKSGVYVGAEEPTDPDVNVWIDPDGSPYDFDAGAVAYDSENEYPDGSVGQGINDLKSHFENAENFLGIVEGFEGVNAAIAVDGNIVTATKGNAGNWYAFGIKNAPLKFRISTIEYLLIGYGVSSGTQNYDFFLTAVINSGSNFGKAYVFSRDKRTGTLGTDHALSTVTILGDGAVYSTSPIIDLSYSGTNVTVVYNGVANTVDLSSINVSTSLPGTFSAPMFGVVCHASTQGASFTLAYNNALTPLINLTRWAGKKWCAFGDSIVAQAMFVQNVVNQLQLLSCTTMGVGGSTIAELYAGQTAAYCNRYDTIASGFDVITISGGTNDFGKNIPLGTATSIEKTTFYGGLKSLLTGIKTKFPTTPILFFTPLQRDYFGTAEEISGMVNGNGNTLKEYVDIIIEQCAEQGIPCFDMYSMSGLYPENVHAWTIDGLHPNQTFWNTHYQLIGDFILKYLPTA